MGSGGGEGVMFQGHLGGGWVSVISERQSKIVIVQGGGGGGGGGEGSLIGGFVD